MIVPKQIQPNNNNNNNIVHLIDNGINRNVAVLPEVPSL